jgi:hypothetical protein
MTRRSHRKSEAVRLRNERLHRADERSDFGEAVFKGLRDDLPAVDARPTAPRRAERASTRKIVPR